MLKLSTDLQLGRSKNAAPLAEGHGADAIIKAELKARRLHNLLADLEATAKTIDSFGLTIAQQCMLAELIDLADELTPDPDFEPWLGWTDRTPVYTNPPILRNGWPVRVMPYETNALQDDREIEHDEEDQDRAFQNEMPWDEFSGVNFRGGENV